MINVILWRNAPQPEFSSQAVDATLSALANHFETGHIAVVKQGRIEFHRCSFWNWQSWKHWFGKVFRCHGYRATEIRALLNTYITANQCHLPQVFMANGVLFRRRHIKFIDSTQVLNLAAAVERVMEEQRSRTPKSLQQLSHRATHATSPHTLPKTPMTDQAITTLIESLNDQNRNTLLPQLFEVMGTIMDRQDLYMPKLHFHIHYALASPAVHEQWKQYLDAQHRANPTNPSIRAALVHHYLLTHSATTQNISPLLAVPSIRGNPELAYLLATCYSLGVLSPPDPRDNMEWMRTAAELGHPDAQCNIGLLLFDEAREEYIVRAAKKGVLYAMEWLLQQGHKLNPQAAIARWEQLQTNADLTPPLTLLLVGHCLRYGIGTGQDLQGAIIAWLQSARGGNRIAQALLPIEILKASTSILATIPDLPTPGECAHWLLQAAEHNATPAQRLLAQFYASADTEDVQLLRGNPAFTAFLGKPNPEKAREWYQRMSYSGYADDPEVQKGLTV